MNFWLRSKKGAAVDDDTFTWILWILVLIAIGIGLKLVISRFSS
jgi:hypothetical protein